jgi:hypothetical protein
MDCLSDYSALMVKRDMKDYFFVEILIWFVVPTAWLGMLNLYCILRKIKFSLIYYLYSLGVGLFGLLFAPTAFCNEFNEKCIILLVIVNIVSIVLVIMAVCKLFIFKKYKNT